MPANYKIRLKPKARSKKPTRCIASSVNSLELKEPSAHYFVRNVEIPEFFGQQTTKGERLSVNGSKTDALTRLFYSHPHGEIWQGD